MPLHGRPAPELPPPPGELDEPGTRLHWIAIPVAALPIAVVHALGQTLSAAWSYPPGSTGHPPPDIPRVAVMSAWMGAMLLLGPMLAERLLPSRWPRSLKWAIGMLWGWCVPYPGVWAYMVYVIPSTRWVIIRHGLVEGVLRAAVGACIGWAAQSVRSRRGWALTGAGAAAMIVVHLVRRTPYFAERGIGTGHNWWLLAALALARAAAEGACLGLAFAAGLAFRRSVR